jgi:diguanylate cyclase (GGDEF)-like protein/PAS domain S-box-containing protein
VAFERHTSVGNGPACTSRLPAADPEESGPEGIWAVGPDGVTTFANQAAADMLRCGIGELIGRSLFDFVADWQQDVTRRRLLQRSKGRTECSVRHYCRADGGDLWARVAASPRYDAEGRFVGAVARLTDLTEQRRTNAALRDSEERAQRMFDESPLGQAIVGPDLAIADANSALCAALGYGLDELVGEPFSSFTHPEDRDADVEQAQQLFRGEIDTYQLDKRFVRGDGTILIGRLTATVVRDGEGTPRYGIGAIEDVTEKVAIARALAEREDRWRLAIEAADLVAWDYDPATGDCDSSDYYYGIPDGPEHAAKQGATDGNQGFWSLVHPEDRSLLQPDSLRALATPDGSFAVDFRFGPPQGEPRWIHARGRLVLGDDGEVVRISGVGIDFTAQRLAEQRRLDTELEYRRTIEASTDAFIAVDGDLRIVRVNVAAETTFGWSETALKGRPVSLLLPLGSFSRIVQEVCEQAQAHAPSWGGGVGPFEADARRRDGTRFPVEVSVVAIHTDGTASYHAFVRDITERKAAEAALARLALTDTLTGLPNRAALVDRLTGSVRRLQGRGTGFVAVVFVDLDRFKFVNDSLSHEAGDRYLVAVADSLRAAMPPGSIAGRLGGDEFLVIAEDLQHDWQVWALAEQVTRAIATPLWIDGHELRPNASLGIAIARDDRPTAEALVGDADLAMYCGKELGGGRVELFNPAMREARLTRIQLEREIRRAIEKGDIGVEFQPIVASGGAIAGFEALARWTHPQRGLVPPSEFVPLAERTGLATSLGSYMLEYACRQVAVWRRHHPDLYVSVNLSSLQLTDPGLARTVSRILAQNGLPGRALCLEITESALITDPDAAAAVLAKLVELGTRIAVDDYGTGYSSLLYLRRFPVQLLKLDRCFVEELAEGHAEDRAIVSSSIDLAHALGMQAIAEGVESVGQLAVLEELGCDLTQGFLWSPPLDAAATARFLGL